MKLAAGGLVVLIALNWQMVVLILALLVSGFVYEPPVTKGLGEWGKSEFSARLTQAFPAGTPESEFIAMLRKQRFTVDPETRAAEFKREALPCNVRYEVHWAVDANERLIAVEGDHIMVACL